MQLIEGGAAPSIIIEGNCLRLPRLRVPNEAVGLPGAAVESLLDPLGLDPPISSNQFVDGIVDRLGHARGVRPNGVEVNPIGARVGVHDANLPTHLLLRYKVAFHQQCRRLAYTLFGWLRNQPTGWMSTVAQQYSMCT